MKSKSRGSPAWMATFADLMSLLMALFVLLFAMSELEVPKYKAIVESFNETLGNGDTLTPAQEEFFESVAKKIKLQQSQEMPMQLREVLDQEMQEVYQQLNSVFAIAGEDKVRVEYDDDKLQVKIIFPERIAFDAASAQLKPRFIKTLQKLVLLKGQDLIVKVVGHTDSQPITGGRFISNWELSSARASAVISQLLTEEAILPNQAIAIGVADTQPIAFGNTRSDFAKNRRVEVLVTKRIDE